MDQPSDSSSLSNQQDDKILTELNFKRKNLPDKPGCYLYKNAAKEIIYVGKAKSLKKRVNSYWKQNHSQDPLYVQKIQRLVSLIRYLDVYIVENEAEALLLENELIKKHQPFFNVNLKDDKSFPWVQITKEKYPRIKIIRSPERWGLQHKYIGPFVDGYDLKRLIRFIRKIFPYCTCKRCVETQKRTRPCVYYQIKLCPGPCMGKISQEEYLENIQNIENILVGNITPIQELMKLKMQEYSEKLEFENAAIWRDRLNSLNKLTIEQSILNLNYENPAEGDNSITNSISSSKPKWKDMDVIAVHSTQNRAGILIIHVRGGRLIGKTPHIVDITEKINFHQHFHLDLIKQYYFQNEISLPSEIIVDSQLPLGNRAILIKSILEQYSLNISNNISKISRNIVIRAPIEEDKTAGLYRIAQKNIQLLIRQKDDYDDYLKSQDYVEQNGISQGLQDLKDALNLDEIPFIIEGFDMSHTQGTDYVGSMVCFVEGKPSKSHYRRYKVHSKTIPDDVATMHEVMERRYRRVIQENSPLPDLIVVDGGKGQLNMAHQLLNELGIGDIPHIGLAKREEEIFIPNQKESIILSKNSPALHIIQALRDEAHRFAITYHRLLRKKRQTKSDLDAIPGVGPARKRKLLQFFGSVKEIQKASLTEISEVVGPKQADIIVKYFKDKNNQENPTIHPEKSSKKKRVIKIKKVPE